ncbi:MAG: hypothetical protein ABEJ99_04935 [Candidatus Nanohaloarchaea archaeon]
MKVVGVQVLNASDTVIVLDENISPEEFLKNIQDATIDTQYFEDGITVKISLSMKENGREAIISSSSPTVSA